MKYSSLFIVFILITTPTSFINAQVTNLIPSWKSIPQSSSSKIPDYGALIETITSEVQKWGKINCMQSINNQLASKIASARKGATQKTIYVVVVNYTDISNCSVTSFEPQFGKLTPSVIHPPETKVLIYTIEIYPYIVINGIYY